ncbi:hypothetical protein L7F22_063308, partial [Adiantum nelumboides]|nr:hypothetical protein [Adiantum nelumboides]
MPRSNTTPRRATSESLNDQARRRQYQAHRGVLQELQRIERHMQPAIPCLPFQRVVQEICEQWRIGMRWASSALLRLQEIAKDYLVEFFSDGYMLAAHAHRVTIMPWDFDTLQRLRFCFNQLLQLVPIWDVKRNSKDGKVDEGHEQVRVIEETETVMEEPIMHKNEQNMEDAEHVFVSEPAPVSEPLLVSQLVSETAPVSEPLPVNEYVPLIEPAPVSEPAPLTRPALVSELAPVSEPARVSEPAPLSEPVPVGEPTPLSEPVSEALVHVREDAVPLMEDPLQERQGEGSASQRSSNMEPLSDEAMIFAEINEENLQVLIKSAPLHAKIMLPGRSEEGCILTLD